MQAFHLLIIMFWVLLGFGIIPHEVHHSLIFLKSLLTLKWSVVCPTLTMNMMVVGRIYPSQVILDHKQERPDFNSLASYLMGSIVFQQHQHCDWKRGMLKRRVTYIILTSTFRTFFYRWLPKLPPTQGYNCQKWHHHLVVKWFLNIRAHI